MIKKNLPARKKPLEALVAGIRRVRTAAGAEHFDAPIGTPIVKDAVTGKLRAVKSDEPRARLGQNAAKPAPAKKAAPSVGSKVKIPSNVDALSPTVTVTDVRSDGKYHHVSGKADGGIGEGYWRLPAKPTESTDAKEQFEARKKKFSEFNAKMGSSLDRSKSGETLEQSVARAAKDYSADELHEIARTASQAFERHGLSSMIRKAADSKKSTGKPDEAKTAKKPTESSKATKTASSPAKPAETQGTSSVGFVTGKQKTLGKVNTKAKAGDPDHNTPKKTLADGNTPKVGQKVVGPDGKTGEIVETYQSYSKVKFEGGKGEGRTVSNAKLNASGPAKPDLPGKDAGSASLQDLAKEYPQMNINTKRPGGKYAKMSDAELSNISDEKIAGWSDDELIKSAYSVKTEGTYGASAQSVRRTEALRRQITSEMKKRSIPGNAIHTSKAGMQAKVSLGHVPAAVKKTDTPGTAAENKTSSTMKSTSTTKPTTAAQKKLNPKTAGVVSDLVEGHKFSDHKIRDSKDISWYLDEHQAQNSGPGILTESEYDDAFYAVADKLGIPTNKK